MIEEFRELLRKTTYLPPEYIQIAPYMLMSAVAGRNYVVERGLIEYYPNLYTLLIGSSGTGKTYLLRIIENIIRKINSDMLIPHQFTPESLLSHLSKTPHSVLINSEFGEFIRYVREREYMRGIEGILTQLYDCDPIERRTRRTVMKVEEPYLVLLTASQREVLTSELRMRSFFQGIMNRFLFIEGSPQKPRKVDHLHEHKDLYKHVLEEIAMICSSACIFTVSDDGVDRLYRHLEEIRADEDYEHKYLFNRTIDNVMKVAVLEELDALLSDRIPKQAEISRRSMARAVKIVESSVSVVMDLVEDVTTGHLTKLRDKILSDIPFDRWIPYSQIYRKYWRYRTKTVKQLLYELEEMELIECKTEVLKGRPRRLYRRLE